jgi:hypothetical protein
MNYKENAKIFKALCDPSRLKIIDIFESYSAGTETKPQINQYSVRIIKKLYNNVHTCFCIFKI